MKVSKKHNRLTDLYFFVENDRQTAWVDSDYVRNGTCSGKAEGASRGAIRERALEAKLLRFVLEVSADLQQELPCTRFQRAERR